MTQRRRAWLALLPAIAAVGGLSAYALADTIAESLGRTGATGAPVSLDAYRHVMAGQGFWRAALFSLWVAAAGTAVSAAGAVAVAWAWTRHPGRPRRVRLWILQLNVTIPHVVWAVALLATFSQSGSIARVAHAVGLIDRPDQFPVVVTDRHGIGIIAHLVTKELPFLVLLVLPVAGASVASLSRAAAGLGASPWQQLRLVFLPAITPALAPGAAVAFAFALGSYEPAAVLGVRSPRTLAVIALERFRDPDLAVRAEAMAMSVLLAATTMAVTAAGWLLARAAARRRATRSRRSALAARVALAGPAGSAAPTAPVAPARSPTLAPPLLARWFARAATATVTATGLAVLVVPLATITVSAVSIRWFFPELVPSEWTLTGVRDVLGGADTLAALRTGLVISLTVTVLAMVLAWPAARRLADSAFAGRAASFAVLFLPSVLPAVGLAIGIDVLALRTGLAGHLPAVIVAHLVPSLPYAIAVLAATFSRFDVRLEQQACTLGATRWQAWRAVTVRAVAPGLVVAALFTFLVSWSQYLLTLLVGSGDVTTLTMLVFTEASGGNATRLGTIAVLDALPAALLLAAATPFLRRQLEQPSPAERAR